MSMRLYFSKDKCLEPKQVTEGLGYTEDPPQLWHVDKPSHLGAVDQFSTSHKNEVLKFLKPLRTCRYRLVKQAHEERLTVESLGRPLEFGRPRQATLLVSPQQAIGRQVIAV